MDPRPQAAALPKEEKVGRILIELPEYGLAAKDVVYPYNDKITSQTAKPGYTPVSMNKNGDGPVILISEEAIIWESK